MTTPERLRRRQRIEGAFLVFIGIMLAVSTLWFRNQDQQQRTCLADVVDQQNAVLTARGQIASRDSAVNAKESAATRSLIVKVFSAEDREAALKAFADTQAAWAVVDKERKAISEDRASNPYPDFPAGTCE